MGTAAYPAAIGDGSPGPAALLLLADGRFPAGGHAHSGTFEAVSQLEGINDVPSMQQFLLGRLHTVGVVAAAFAAAACAAVRREGHATGDRSDVTPIMRLAELDSELDARTPSPALRTTSRRLGRQALRAGRLIWPNAILEALTATITSPHQPVAFGAVAAAAGLAPADAALAVAHDATIGPATAAVRLLGLDPFTVHAALARLAPDINAVAAQGAQHVHSAPDELPATSAPLLDIAAEYHSTWEVRLFAS